MTSNVSQYNHSILKDKIINLTINRYKYVINVFFNFAPFLFLTKVIINLVINFHFASRILQFPQSNVRRKPQTKKQQESDMGLAKIAVDIKDPRNVQEDRRAQDSIREELRRRKRLIRQQPQPTKIVIGGLNWPQPLSRQTQSISQRTQKDQSLGSQRLTREITLLLQKLVVNLRRRVRIKGKKTIRIQ